MLKILPITLACTLVASAFDSTQVPIRRKLFEEDMAINDNFIGDYSVVNSSYINVPAMAHTHPNGTRVRLGHLAKRSALDVVGTATGVISLAVDILSSIIGSMDPDADNVKTRMQIARVPYAAGTNPVVYFKRSDNTEDTSRLCRSSTDVCSTDKCVNPSDLLIDTEDLSKGELKEISVHFGTSGLCFDYLAFSYGTQITPSDTMAIFTGDMLFRCNAPWGYNGLVDSEGRGKKCVQLGGINKDVLRFYPAQLDSIFRDLVAKAKNEGGDINPDTDMTTICENIDFLKASKNTDTCTTDTKTTGDDTILKDSPIGRATYLFSASGEFYARITADGNYCIFRNPGPGDQPWAYIWCASPGGYSNGSFEFKFSKEGMPAIYNKDGVKVYDFAGSRGNGYGNTFTMDGDGHLYLKSSTGNILWKSSDDNGCYNDGSIYMIPFNAPNRCYYKPVDVNPPPTSEYTTTNSIPAKSAIEANKSIYGKNGGSLIMHSGSEGGNLCAYDWSGRNFWCSGNTAGKAPFRAYLETDGNICIYDSTGKNLKCTGNHVNSGLYWLIVDDLTNIQIRDGSNKNVWNIPGTITPGGPLSMMPIKPVALTTKNSISTKTTIKQDGHLDSPNGSKVYLHPDGNLCTYGTKAGKYVNRWCLGSVSGTTPFYAYFETNGAICVYDANGATKRCSKGFANTGEYKLFMHDDGYLYVLNKNKIPVWVNELDHKP